MSVGWTRNAPWRQGDVVPGQAAAQLGLLHGHEEVETACALLISHDCDLAIDDMEVEPDVEVVVGRIVERADGNFTWGKSTRTLHLLGTVDGDATTIELPANRKALVPKQELAAYTPDKRYKLDGKQLNALRRWLSARYLRTAFPDAFVSRMQRCEADKRLARLMDRHGALITSVYVDLGDAASAELGDGNPYRVTVVLAHDSTGDAVAAGIAADKAADEVAQLLTRRFNPADLHLQGCFAISEDDLPVSRARLLAEWRLEYLTLRSE